MPRYSYVLFDADETLFDFNRAENRAIRQTLSAHGLPADSEVVARYHTINQELWDRMSRGEVTREVLVLERFAVLLRELGRSGDPETLNRFYVARLGEGTDLLPGAEDLCRALAPHCTLAIVTNGVVQSQRNRFSRSSLCGVIPHLFISGELGYYKPQPEYFDAVCAALNIQDRRQAVIVGDSLNADILGGRNAGIDTVWYNPAGLPRDPAVPPTWEVPNYTELERILLH